MWKLGALVAVAAVACQPGPEGPPGPMGTPGAMGAMGSMGKDGAGPGGAPVAPNKSGSRLQVQWSVMKWADGAQTVLGSLLYDTQLKAQCLYQLGIDRTWRCQPSVSLVVFVGFTDAMCKMPFGYRSDLDMSAATFGSSATAGGPWPGTAIFRVDREMAQPPMTYQLGDGGRCSLTGNPSPTQAKFYALTGPLDPSMFVAGEYAVVE